MLFYSYAAVSVLVLATIITLVASSAWDIAKWNKEVNVVTIIAIACAAIGDIFLMSLFSQTPVNIIVHIIGTTMLMLFTFITLVFIVGHDLSSRYNTSLTQIKKLVDISGVKLTTEGDKLVFTISEKDVTEVTFEKREKDKVMVVKSIVEGITSSTPYRLGPVCFVTRTLEYRLREAALRMYVDKTF